VNFIPASTRGDPRWDAEQTALMDALDTLLLGRVTYEMFSQIWPSRSQGEEKEFADKFNGLQARAPAARLALAPLCYRSPSPKGGLAALSIFQTSPASVTT
jgi:hypothetical protein